MSDILIEDGVSRSQSIKIEGEILKTIAAPRHYNMVVGSLGSDTLVVADPVKKKVNYETVVIKNDRDYSRSKTVIEAYPEEITVYDSPLVEEPRKFEIKWKSSIKHVPLITGPDLLEDIKNDLIRDGYVTANRLINDVLPALMNTFVRQGLAKIKTDIETPGFFFDQNSNKMLNIKYDLTEQETDELKQALTLLNELAKWYKGNEIKLATVFKWGLIAPFIYSMKQQGTWVPWLYLYGKAKSGKTTLGKMILYMWGKPGENNDLTGSGFNTEARIGGKIGQSTFPIIINEPGGAFNKINVVEMIKGAIERTISRGRYEGRRYTNKPSFNPVIFTANQYIPNDDALVRRLIIQSFSHDEKKEDEEIAAFEKEWQIKNHKKCKFNAFKSITQVAALEYTSDSQLWDMDWKELANTILTRVYLDAGMEPPNWIYKWSQSEDMDDLDEEYREGIRILLLEQINQAYGKVQIIDPETGRTLTDDYDRDIKTTNNFKEKVWMVLNERLIPWMEPKEANNKKDNKKYVCFTIGFKKEVHTALKLCQPLNSIAQLLGWEYKNVKLPHQNKIQQKVIIVRLDEFLEFLYPSGGFDVE